MGHTSGGAGGATEAAAATEVAAAAAAAAAAAETDTLKCWLFCNIEIHNCNLAASRLNIISVKNKITHTNIVSNLHWQS